EGAEKTMVIVDTGWSTTGLMNFANNLLAGEPEAIAEMLAEKAALPDLSGVTVYWLQLGDVAEPETELSPAQVKKLGDIWQAVIKKAGGNIILSDSIPNNGAIGGSLPEVTTISHEAEAPVVINTSAEGELTALSFETPLFFSEDQVQFLGDSDEYADESVAMKSIEPIAAYMKDNTDFNLLLVGTTAGDENTSYAKDLSYRRAEAVKGTLLDLGIDESRIITRGLGSGDKWHIYGAGTTGALAAQNRKVVLLDASSLDASELLGED
ncbi:MAG: OmpA family protein, partial [Butyrivibrio sp.]|nr:OmpA family protein [Butyrivibrio sp.]